MYSACGPPALGAIQSIKNAGIKPGEIILVGFDASPDEVKAIKAGTETGSVAQFPAKIGSLGIATLYEAVAGQEGAEERRHRHRARHEGEREQVLGEQPPGERPAVRDGAGASAPGSRQRQNRSHDHDDRRRPPPLLEPRAGGPCPG